MAREEQTIAGRGAVLFDPLQQQRLRQAQAKVIALDQANNARTGVHHSAGTGIEPVSQGADSGLDPCAQRLIDILVAIEDAGDGANGNTGMLRDVFHRRGGRAAAHVFRSNFRLNKRPPLHPREHRRCLSAAARGWIDMLPR